MSVVVDDTAIGLLGLLGRRSGVYGGGSILHFILHAAVWAAVERVVRRLPFGLVAVIVSVAVVVGVWGWFRSRSRRISRQARW